ncbi:MAG: biotin transporter BioY [Anaerolineae bacterium]
MAVMTYADLYRPQTARRAAVYDGLVVLGGALLIAVSAQIAVPLPFSPVPVTGQTFGVLLVGMLLGMRRGTASVLTYLAQGALGWPVFAGGTGGWPVLLGPTGGYLVGFVAAAALTGWLAERGWDRRVGATLLAMVLGNALIYLFGVTRLAGFAGVEAALSAGMFPFVVGDVVKALLAAGALPLGWRVLGRH